MDTTRVINTFFMIQTQFYSAQGNARQDANNKKVEAPSAEAVCLMLGGGSFFLKTKKKKKNCLPTFMTV